MGKRGVFRTKHKTRGDNPIYAKRNPDGTFNDLQSIGRANIQEHRAHAKTKVKSGQGFRGDTT